MFQTVTDCPEEIFEDVAEAFYSNVCNKELITPVVKSFDLQRQYVVNYACAWNDVKNIGKTCCVMVKNDRIAHVMFDGEAFKASATFFYRLEDLSLKSNS